MPFTSNLPAPPNLSYWAVAGNPTQVYSAAAVGYVPLTDPTYQAWIAQGNSPTFVPAESDLWGILAQQVPSALPAGNAAAVPSQINSILLLKVLFWIVNQILTLQSKPTVTKVQFFQILANLSAPS